MFVLPSRIAPARATLRATSLSDCGTKSARIFEPAVVRIPRVQKLSLSEIGIPWSGPRARPRCISRSAVFACRRASSARTVRKARSEGFDRSIRRRHASTRSTGEIFLRHSSRAACSMERNDSSVSEWAVMQSGLKDLLLAPQIPGGAEVRNAEDDAVLVLVADRAERKAPVFKTYAAARAVVGHLHDLVLKRLLDEIVTGPEGDVPAAAVLVPVTKQCPYLIGVLLEIRRRRRRIQRKIQRGKVRKRDERFLVRFVFQKSPDRGQPVALRIVVDDKLRVKALARLDGEVAHDRRKTARLVRKGKRRECVECLKHVGLAGNERAAKRGVEEVFLSKTPGDELFGVTGARAAVQALRDSILDFVGVSQRIVLIESQESSEIIHAVYVAIHRVGFDYVLPLRCPALVHAFKYGHADVDRQLLGVAEQPLVEKRSASELAAVIRRAKSEARGHAEPLAKMQRDRHGRREFAPPDESGRFKRRYVLPAMLPAGKRIERKIDGEATEECLVDRTDAGFRSGAQRNGSLRGGREIVLIAQCREIQAESIEIVCQESGIAHLGIYRFLERL